MNIRSVNSWSTMRRSPVASPVRLSRRRRSRSGVGLVFVAILLFVIFAIGGLVIDLGLMWVTQSRLTTAADSTALEGLRWRDQAPDTMNPNDLANTPADHDTARRQAAATLANIIFANNVANNTPPTDRDGQFGSGPLFVQTPGTIGSPELNAGETLVPADPSTYKPTLQLNNADNLDSGDIVSGEYKGASTLTADATQLSISHRQGYTGSDRYSRDDFTVADASGAPADSSLLVRMGQSDCCRSYACGQRLGHA